MDDLTSSLSVDRKSSLPGSAGPLLDELTDVQLAALGGLAEGKTIRATAQEIGVSRDTISRWIRCDVAFRAAYNHWRQELIDSTRGRLLRTAESAAVALHKAIIRGDGRLALSLLKHLGLVEPASSGPVDRELVENEIAIAAEEERRVLHHRAYESGQSELSPAYSYWRNHLRKLQSERAATTRELEPPQPKP
jgi:hypothetical protein